MKRISFKSGPHLLAVNRLEPYSSWDEFLPAIKNAFDAYLEIAEPKALARLGLRYINRITIPKGLVLMEDYFDCYPYLGQRLPQTHGPFIIGVQFPFEGGKDTLRLQLQSLASPSPDAYGILLDLDYFTAGQGRPEFQDMSEWLNRAHDKVEEVFEACLKDTTKKLFNPIT